jgi:hypothetical protein
MDSNRAGHRLSARPAFRRQAGITVIGLLFLVAFIGFLGLAALNIAPLYLQRMKINAVLDDVQDQLATGGNTVSGIRLAMNDRFYIESVRVDDKEMEIAREGDGFSVNVHKELRKEFMADLWFVVVIDEQIQVAR